MKRTLALLIALTTSLLCAAAIAADRPLPGALASMQAAGKLKVEKQFPAEAGLTGYLVKQGYRYRIAYGRDGYLIVGPIISPQGKNLSATYLAKYAPKPDYGAIVRKLKAGGHLLALGHDDAPTTLYVFEDPNCLFCDRLNKALLPQVDAGKVRLEVALVAFLKPDSLGRATAILGAKAPAAAFRQNETKYDEAHEEGGYPAAATPDPKLAAPIRAHGILMQQAGFNGTPGIIYRDHTGKWQGIGGMPDPARLKAIVEGK